MADEKKFDWRQALKNKLVENRSRQESGSGDAYWESVVDTIEAFARRNDHRIEL